MIKMIKISGTITKIYTVIFLTFFIHVYAKDTNTIKIKDTNISTQEMHKSLPNKKKRKKSSRSTYRKFEKMFSDYNKHLIEDVVTYSVDIFIPDELIRATKDVIKNREKKGFDSHIEKIAKELGNDAYNIVLTTSYYHMQDISRITEDLWDEHACNPDSFEYTTSKEPKEPLLDLKENDQHARGVTNSGVILPINDNFPNAFYPYAAIPNGCSAEGLQDLYEQSNDISNDDTWLREACNEHDRCYFTEGSSSKECNAKFIISAVDACNSISTRDTILFLGTKNAFCGIKGLTISTGANSCAKKYFAHAQKQQKAYNHWISRYEKMYFRAKQIRYNQDR